MGALLPKIYDTLVAETKKRSAPVSGAKRSLHGTTLICPRKRERLSSSDNGDGAYCSSQSAWKWRSGPLPQGSHRFPARFGRRIPDWFPLCQFHTKIIVAGIFYLSMENLLSNQKYVRIIPISPLFASIDKQGFSDKIWFSF